VPWPEDPLVPFQSLADAEAALKQAGVPVGPSPAPASNMRSDQEGCSRRTVLRQVLA